MRIPPQTSDIFTFLSQGQFISRNSHDARQSHLYEVIAQHEADLREYFSVIDLHLQRGAGYFYFTRAAEGNNFEERMDKVLKQLALLDFLLAYHPHFGPGLQFTMEDIWQRCEAERGLMQRLEKLPVRPAAGPPPDKLRQLLRLLERDTFLESDREGHYRVLAAFDYLLQLIDRIDLIYDQQTP